MSRTILLFLVLAGQVSTASLCLSGTARWPLPHTRTFTDRSPNRPSPFRLRLLGILPEADTAAQTRQISKPGKPFPRAFLQQGGGDTVREEWVRHFTSNQIASTDFANAIAVDSAGNVYATGVSYATYSDGDYLTVKYSPRGDTLWTRRFNGDQSGYDEATAIATDKSGNVYVTGYSFGGHTDFNITTIKYTPDGATEWVREYNGPADSADIPTAMAIDSRGNIDITGYSYSTQTDIDFITISYSPSGAGLWIKTYSGPGLGIDVATGIAADSSGGVSVAGYSAGAGTDLDYATVTYAADGTQSWVRRYNSPWNGPDIATALGIDGSGNRYVTGYVFRPGSGTDYTTIMYDSAGAQQWVRLYNGPSNAVDKATAITVAPDGTAYVTGFSYDLTNAEDYLTIQYTSGGVVEWTARYNSPENAPDIPLAVEIDTVSSSVYVSGSTSGGPGHSRDYITVRYDLLGRELAVSRYNGPDNSDDFPSALAVDRKGNVFVTGGSLGLSQSYDYATVKYFGSELGRWPARFNSGFGINHPSAIAVDNTHHVYVAGTDSAHIVTAKFDSAGNRLWANGYPSGPGSSAFLALDGTGAVVVSGAVTDSSGLRHIVLIRYDNTGTRLWWRQLGDSAAIESIPAAISVDSSSFIYVTGSARSSGALDDYLTIKCTPGGAVQWTARYNGDLHNRDDASAIAVDGEGNVYVTGTSVRSGTSNDYVTVKYSPQGQQQWVGIYDGPGHGSDFARAIALDGAGNVYVTGTSYGLSSGSDFATLKYTPAGVQRWVARYDGPEGMTEDAVALTVAPGGVTTVTGSSYSDISSVNYATVQYDSNGIQQWVAVYNGPGNGVDMPVAILSDILGNIYVTGTSLGFGSLTDYATVKYTPAGVQEWVARYNGFANGNDRASAMALDSRGYVYVTGQSTSMEETEDILTVKYTSVGTTDQYWPVRYEGPGVSMDEARAATSNSAGELCILGSSGSSGTSSSLLALKYSGDGTLQWSASYQDPYNDLAGPAALATDSLGNLYMTETAFGQKIPTDIATFKYDTSGNRVWFSYYNGAADSYDFAAGIALDESLNVYVGGSSWSGTSYDYILLKYSSGGVLRWAARYDGPDHGDDLSYAMAVDKGGNIYLTGQSFGSGNGADYATVKFSPDGVILWAARYNGTLNNDDRALSVAVNSTGNVYVTGWSAGADNTYDMVTIMYDSSGAQKWIAIYASPEHKNDMAAALALDKNGNTYVTGRSYTSGQDDGDYIVIRYDSTGTERWVARYDGPGRGDDEPRAIAVDSGGFVYVTGRSVGTDGSYDFATLKYSPSGTLQWYVRYASPTKSDDDARSIVVDGLGNVMVTGMSHSLAWSDITIIKYSQTVTSVRGGEAVLPGTFQLFQNYPNPFNSTTVIAYRLPARSHVTLKLYNILGQEVASLVNETQEAGPRWAIWRAAASSGVYFYRLNAVNAADPRRSFSEVRKMVLLE